jgi:luciferase-type oxidoreductase
MLLARSTARIEATPGFRRMFRPGQLTVGAFLPVADWEPDGSTTRDQEGFVRRAQALGFAALWCREMPGRDPTLAQLGRNFDAWVHLDRLAAQTHTIALASGSPLRNALHVAKIAASIDRHSGGRLVLGLAAADPSLESPAFGADLGRRASWYRERFEIVRSALDDECPVLRPPSGTSAHGAAVTARPLARPPMLVTGDSAQPLRWIAERADGWLTYPRSIERQAMAVARWRTEVEAVAPGRFKPFAQSLCVDLADRPSLAPTPIHLGFKAGRHFVLRFLESLRLVGVNHVVLNLHHGARAPGEVLEEIGSEVLAPLAVAQGADRIGAELEAGGVEDAHPAQH